MKSDTVRSV